MWLFLVYTLENYVSKEVFSSFSFLCMDMMALKYSRRMGIGSHQFHYIFVVKSIKIIVPVCALQLLWELNACALCLQQEFLVCVIKLVIAAIPRLEIEDTLCS